VGVVDMEGEVETEMGVVDVAEEEDMVVIVETEVVEDMGVVEVVEDMVVIVEIEEEEVDVMVEVVGMEVPNKNVFNPQTPSLFKVSLQIHQRKM